MTIPFKNKSSVLTADFLISAALCLYAGALYFASIFSACATVLLVAAVLAFVLKGRTWRRPHPLVYCFLAVYLVRAVWLLFSNDPQNGVRWLDSSLPFIILPLLFQYLPWNDRILKTVLTFFVRFTLLFCVVALCSIAYYSFTTPIGLREWLLHPKTYCELPFAWTSYGHTSFLCVIYLMALPVALFLKRRYHAISGTELWILIVVIALTIAFSGARIGLVIFPLLLLMMLFYILPPKRKIIAAGGLLLALAGAVFLFCALPENNFTERFKDPIREQLFETAVASIQENPLLGTGTGGMVAPINSPELAEKLGYAEPQPFTYPHNQYLGEVMHFGFIGAVALFVTLAYLVFLALRKKDFLLQSVLVILFVFMLSEMPFDSNKGITFALFFISLFVYTLPLRTGGGLKSA